MRKFLFASIAFGLPIIGSSLAISAPAHATIWKNLATIRSRPVSETSEMCLGVANGQNNNNRGQGLVLWHCDGSANQNWTESTFVPDPSYSWFLTTVGVGIGAPRMMAMGVSGGTMANNSRVIDWTQTNDLNQGWAKFLKTSDFRGHDCFYFLNKASPLRPPVSYVLSVQDRRVDAGAPVVITELSFSPQGEFNVAGRPDQYWCAY